MSGPLAYLLVVIRKLPITKVWTVAMFYLVKPELEIGHVRYISLWYEHPLSKDYALESFGYAPLAFKLQLSEPSRPIFVEFGREGKRGRGG